MYEPENPDRMEKGIWSEESLTKIRIYLKLREIASQYKATDIDKAMAVLRCRDALMELKASSHVAPAHWEKSGECSHCKKKAADGVQPQPKQLWFPPYCPHCGAKMGPA